MSVVRFIGDVHGKLQQYAERCRKYPDTVCLGEMGFDLKDLVLIYLKHSAFGDEETPRHLILPGNHDNYDQCRAFTTFLTRPGFGAFTSGPLVDRPSYYIRGAASIDKMYRIEGKSWWADEELTSSQLRRAVDGAVMFEPDIMVTHTCPDAIISKLLRPGQEKYNFRTEQALQAILEMAPPKLWIFGHFHTTRVIEIGETTFIALGELATCDLEVTTLDFELSGGEGYSWE